MNWPALILILLKVSIVLTVFALGLEATVGDATSLFRRPRELGRAFLSLNVVMPLVAVALAVTFDLKPPVKIALVALSVSPLPPMVPKQLFKAGGQRNYIVGLLTGAAVVAIFFTPLTMWIIGWFRSIPVHMSVTAVAAVVLQTILAPLFVGIIVRALLPALAQRIARPLGAAAFVLLMLFVLPVLFGHTRAIVSLMGDGTLLSLTGFAFVGYFVGHFFGGPDPEGRRVLAISTASRHPGMAVAIARTNFPEERLAVPAVALYLIIAVIVCALLSKQRGSKLAAKSAIQA
jgi:bile acid:Na+ symporter, BASS family